MKDPITGVEISEHAPVTTTVETKTEGAVTSESVDYKAILEETQAQLIKIDAEKENYRKGMLKAKGKPADDYGEEDSEDIDEKFRRIAREELLKTQESQLIAKRDDTLKNVLKQNEELRLALKNRASVGTATASGSNQEKNEVKDTFFTDAQLAELKRKGLDPAKVKANMLKSQGLAKPQ